MISYVLYGLYNLIYQGFLLGILSLAGVYFNDRFVPNSFLWKDGHRRMDTLPATVMQSMILLIEAVLLILLIYYINRWYLSHFVKANNSNAVATWTAYINLAITVLFIGFVIYTSN